MTLIRLLWICLVIIEGHLLHLIINHSNVGTVMSILCQTNWMNLSLEFLQTNPTSWLSLKFIQNLATSIQFKYHRVHNYMQNISTKQTWSLYFCTFTSLYFKDYHLSAIPFSESVWCRIPLESGDCLLWASFIVHLIVILLTLSTWMFHHLVQLERLF